MSGKIEGKRALITGANRGLGASIARLFHQEGASVLLCARDEAPLRETALSLSRDLKRVKYCVADVSCETDVQKTVALAEKEWGGLDILVNNAGIYGPMGRLHEIDWQAWVKAIEINLLGSVAMARAVLPMFLRQKAGRIIQLSGGGATNPLPNISAYAASKAAAVRLAETLALEYRNDHIFVNAIAPGALNTRLLDEVLDAGPDRVGNDFYQKAIRQKEQGGASPDKAAELAVFLASDASYGITGKLFSAVWDPWKQIETFREQLMSSDVYTLRRIVPKDRGFEWEQP